jgi:transposase
MSGRVADDRKAEVLRLRYVEGLSTRAIAKKLSMARRTVRDLVDAQRARRVPRRPPAPRESMLARFDAEIRARLKEDPDLRAPALLERLRDLGYRGGISILRDRMRELRPKPHIEVFSSFTEIRPAQRLEVDWAHMGYAIPGVPREVSVFVALLVYSRLLYLEFALSRGMGSFLRCMDRAMAFFGGLTAVDVFDGMKTVVLGRAGGQPIFAPRFVEYARARGFAISATLPRTPTGKPFVERGIGFFRQRFLPGRRFASFEDLRMQGGVWRDTFANRREHETTGKVPALVFEHEEKALLRPISERAFDTDDLHSTSVDKTHQLYFDRNHYTVPWRLAGQRVLVRADDELVRVLLGPKEVARHARSWSVAETIRDDRHELDMRGERVRRHAGALPRALEHLGEIGVRYFATLAATRRSIRTEEQRLVLLCELFGAAATASAIDEVMRTGHVGAEYVEHVMRHKRRLVPAPPALRLGDPALDAISLREPDLALYDDIAVGRPLRDPGEPPRRGDEEETT